MSRSGYSDNWDNYNIMNLYRGTVDRAIGGKRGQAFLRDLAAAMDAMPDKKLIIGELIDTDGDMCTIGVLRKMRGLDVSKVDVNCPEEVGELVGIARSMATEIEYLNDEEGHYSETPEQRWARMRKWIDENLKTPLQGT